MKSLLLLLGIALQAHDLGVTGVQLRIAGGKTYVRVQTHAMQLQGRDPGTELPKRLRLRLNGELFTAADGRVEPVTETGIVAWEASKDGAPDSIVMDAPLFPEDDADRTLVTLLRDGTPAGEAILSATSQPVSIGETGSAALRRFVPIGVEHILFGPDHIAFLLALLLPGGRWRSLLWVVTGFTVAHSVTLALAVLGYVRPLPWLVEGVIALSIVAAAGENLLAKGERGTGVRAMYAAGFGLVHGFGFAGALGEVGLPEAVLGWALAGFNLGVELGQLGIVLLVVPLLARMGQRERVVRYGSMAIMAVGLYWTVERLFLG
ncbi:MAG TPA: HupE/UreJ family protein [Bryobacteraceae bacterium]|nr:HupE/UreJ family protein [Bryobacteraceae bacterium]